MALSPKHAVVAVVAAAVLGALLIGGPGTFATLSATKTGATLAITSGTITASVTGPTASTFSVGTAPSGVVLNTPTVGMVPGVQDEALTYSVTNSASSATQASITSVRVLSSSVPLPTNWADIRPYLVVTVTVGTAAAVTVPAAGITSTGIDATVATSGKIAPGASVSVVVQFDLPATSGTTDLTRSLQGDQNLAAIIQLAPVFTLTQISRAA